MLIIGHLGYVGRSLNFPYAVGYDLQEGNNILDKYKLEMAFEKGQFKTVIHLAALTGVQRSMNYPHEYITTNMEGTWNVVKMCEKYGIKKLIFFSSSSVYGNSFPPVKEIEVKHPISLYGITKLAGEGIVNSSFIPTTVIRPFTLYPGRSDQVIGKWLKQIQQNRSIIVYGDEESCRGYTYVGDIKQIVEKLVDMNWAWEHEDFNIGGLEPIKLSMLISIFKQKFPDIKVEYKVRPKEDVSQQYADITKARKILDFQPELLFTERVQQILKEELK